MPSWRRLAIVDDLLSSPIPRPPRVPPTPPQRGRSYVQTLRSRRGRIFGGILLQSFLSRCLSCHPQQPQAASGISYSQRRCHTAYGLGMTNRNVPLCAAGVTGAEAPAFPSRRCLMDSFTKVTSIIHRLLNSECQANGKMSSLVLPRKRPVMAGITGYHWRPARLRSSQVP